MSGHEQPGYIDRLMGACLKVLGAAIALYVAVYLVQTILWPLILIVGGGVLIWLAVVVIRTLRERW
ncbi:hypothetical protein [Nocardia brasiliensis]|uniref:hypothetical protein n=1 Tax=Nocardia brasiliensis TaxID=37326 RepID=UPI003D8E6F74